jgi:hypothetical protein
VNDPPAEDKLYKVSGGNIVTVPEECDGMHPRLFFDALFQLFDYVCTQFPVYNKFPQPLTGRSAGMKLQRKIAFG